MKRAKEQGNEYLNNAKTDAKNSGAGTVENTPLPVRRTSSWTPSRAWARTRRRIREGKSMSMDLARKTFSCRA